MSSDLAQPMFSPKAVAIYGASNDPNKNTGRPQRFLEAHGFAGNIYPVNPNRSVVQGRTAFSSVADIPEQIDHALIMVPQPAVLTAVKDCAASGVKVVTIYSDGFGESGAEGLAEQLKVIAVAKDAGMRVVGPNSIGTINLGAALILSANASLEDSNLRAGGTAVVSQSGSLIGSLLSRGAARGVGFSTLVSVGNEADLSVGEIVDLLAQQPDTETILLFLEAISDPSTLARAVGRARAAGKPVVVYKLGRSSVGRDLAVAHTGAIAGSHEAAEAFFKHHGIYQVSMFETLFEIGPLLKYSGIGTGKKVVVLTTTGGGAAMVVDRLGEAGVEIVSAPQSVREVASGYGIFLGNGPLVDLTMAGVREDVYRDVLEAALKAPGIDLVLAVVGSSAQHHPELAVRGVTSAEKTGRPLAVFLTPEAMQALSLLRLEGIAAFRTPEGCADAISALLSTSSRSMVTSNDPVPAMTVHDFLDRSESSITFDELSSRRFLEAHGVGSRSYALVDESEICLPSTLDFPVVAKMISPDIPHKTEAGVVRVGIQSMDELTRTVDELYAAARSFAPQASLSGVLVEPMVSALAEVLVGFRWDIECGPIIVLGVGGVLTEIYQDVSIRLAPVTEETALEMIAEVKGLAVLRGYRNLPVGDLPALARTVAQLSQLALEAERPVFEAEINPLMVMEQGKGVAVVDALVRVADVPGL